MLYNIIVFLLTVAGIAGAFYFSEKIARGPVRHVGMIRHAPGSVSKVPDANGAEVDALRLTIAEGVYRDAYFDAAKKTDVGSSALDRVIFERLYVEGFTKHRHRKMWRCDKCGLVQYCGKDLRCRSCASSYTEKIEESLSEKVNEVEAQVRLQSRMLDKHFEMFASLEKKVRELEMDKLRKSQESEHEAPGPAVQSFEN
jgi:hypothetical protein